MRFLDGLGCGGMIRALCGLCCFVCRLRISIGFCTLKLLRVLDGLCVFWNLLRLVGLCLLANTLFEGLDVRALGSSSVIPAIADASTSGIP